MTEHKTDKGQAPQGHLSGAGAVQPTSAPIAVPDEVQGAWQAWRLTAVLEVLVSLSSLAVYWLAPDAFISDIGAREAFPTFTQAQLEVLVKSMLVLALVAAVIICVVFIALAGQMRKGKLGARFILSAGSVYLVIVALLLFVTPGNPTQLSAPTWLQFVTAALQIASAAAAAAGLVLVSTKQSGGYFEKKNPGAKLPGQRGRN
nr:hypothetical protein [Corynebacterium lactis]